MLVCLCGWSTVKTSLLTVGPQVTFRVFVITWTVHVFCECKESARATFLEMHTPCWGRPAGQVTSRCSSSWCFCFWMTPPPMKEECYDSLSVSRCRIFFISFHSLPTELQPHLQQPHPTDRLAGHTGIVGMWTGTVALSSLWIQGSLRVSSERPAVAFIQ